MQSPPCAWSDWDHAAIGSFSLTRSHGFAQDINARARPHSRPRTGRGGDGEGEACNYVTPQLACTTCLVAVVDLGVRVGFVARLTLMVERRGDRRNPDLAVTLVEVGVLPCGVLLLLR